MLRIGFVGLGAMANNHLTRLREIPEADALAGADINAERRDEGNEKWNLSTYSDYRVMLDNEDLDAVYVVLPPFAHDGQVPEIASRGLPVFVEKPISLDLGYAQETAAVIADNGVINAVGYMFRYLDAVEEAQRLIGDDPIVAMRGFYFAPLPGGPWWRRAELSGGQIVEQGTHVIDLMRYFAGEAVKISGDRFVGVMTDVENYNVDDAANVNIKFENGALANLMTTCVLTNQYCPGLEIITRGRRLWLDLPPRPVRLVQMDGVDEVFESQHDRFIRENEAFVQAVLKNDQSLIRSDYADATLTLGLTLAAQRAVENDGEILLNTEVAA